MRARVAIPWLLLGVVCLTGAITVLSDHDYKGTSGPINVKMPVNAGDATPRSYVASGETLTDGATVTIPWRNGALKQVTIAGNRTLAISGTPKVGERCCLRIKQDGTGNRTVAWPTSGITISWQGGVDPVLTTTANKADVFVLLCTDETGGALKFDGLWAGRNQ